MDRSGIKYGLSSFNVHVLQAPEECLQHAQLRVITCQAVIKMTKTDLDEFCSQLLR